MNILCEVAPILAQAGAIDWVLVALDTVKEAKAKMSALCMVAVVFAEVRAFNQAFAIIEKIDDKKEKASTLSKVASTMAQEGNQTRAVEIFYQALIVTQTIKSDWEKTSALNQTVQNLIEALERTEVLDVVNQVLVTTEVVEENWTKENALSMVVEALKTPNTERNTSEDNFVNSWVKEMYDYVSLDFSKFFLEMIKPADSFQFNLNIGLLLGMITLLKETEDEARVTDFANQALTILETVEDKLRKVLGLSIVSQLQAGLKDKSKVINVINLASVITETIEDEVAKALAFRLVAFMLTTTGQPDQAQSFLRNSFNMARLVGREFVFDMLGTGAQDLAALDQGETLWQVYQAVMEVEGWWSGRMKDEG